MAALEIPEIEDQTAFNLARWDEVCADPVLATLAFRIETDRHGHILMTPTPVPEHGDYQAKIAILLSQKLPEGRVTTECPISCEEVTEAWRRFSSAKPSHDRDGQATKPAAPSFNVT